MNPEIPIFASCIIIVDINIFFAKFTFSFTSSSLYFGFIKNIVTISTSVVSINDNAPLIPNFIRFPIIAHATIPNNGTEFDIHAPNILILNGEISPVSPTIDNISVIVYIGMFFIANTFVNSSIFFFSSL